MLKDSMPAARPASAVYRAPPRPQSALRGYHRRANEDDAPAEEAPVSMAALRSRPHSAVFRSRGHVHVPRPGTTIAADRSYLVADRTSAVAFGAAAAEALEAERRAASAERRRRQARIRLQAQHRRAQELLRAIFDLCEELRLGQQFVCDLQNHFATQPEGDVEAMEAALAALQAHRQSTVTVVDKIETRERVAACMNDFVKAHTGAAGERDEAGQLRRAALTRPEGAKGEAILSSVQICSGGVQTAIHAWQRTADALDAMVSEGGPSRPASAVARSLGQRCGSSVSSRDVTVSLPPPIERRFILRGVDYQRKMAADGDRFKKLRDAWSHGGPSSTRPSASAPASPTLSDTAELSSSTGAGAVMSATARLVAAQQHREWVASRRIQRAWQAYRRARRARYAAIQCAAATTVQRWYRGFLKVRSDAIRRGQSIAATRIQARWRCSSQSRRYAVLRRRHHAAARIQRAVRLYLAHVYWSGVAATNARRRAAWATIVRFLGNIVFQRRFEEHVERKAAAVAIQRWYARLRVREAWHASEQRPVAVLVAKDTALVQADTTISAAPCMQECVEVLDRSTADGTHASQAADTSAADRTITTPIAETVDASPWGPSPAVDSSPAEANRTVVTAARRLDDAFEAVPDTQLLSEAPTAPVPSPPAKPLVVHTADDAVEDSAEPLPEEVPAGTSAYPAYCRRVVARPVSSGAARVFYDSSQERPPICERNFWVGDREAAVVAQRWGRGLLSRIAIGSRRGAAIAEREAAEALATKHAVAAVVQCGVRAWLSAAKAARVWSRERCAAVILQQWWRRWRCGRVTATNRFHREFLDEDDFCFAPPTAHTLEQLRHRKQAAVRLSTWAKRHLDRRHRNAAAQQVIARSWFRFKASRLYWLRRYEARVAAEARAAQVAALEAQKASRARQDAALVILYYYLKHRVRSLIAKMDRICEEIKARPDREENARTLQRFWRASVARIQAMRLRRIRSGATQRSAAEERLLQAAVRLQCLYRAVSARQRVRERRAAIAASQSLAACVIQRNVRALLARLAANHQRMAHLSMYKEYQRLMAESRRRAGTSASSARTGDGR